MSTSSSILLFATQHMPTGGIESHLTEFCKHLSSSGVQIDLVILNSNMTAASEQNYKQWCRKVYLCKQGRSLSRLIWLFKNSLNWIFRQYDAVYTNGQGNSINIFSILTPLCKKWVHHHHTAGDLLDQATWPNGYIKAMRKADSVIACSGKNAIDIASFLNRSVKSIPCFSRQISSAVNRTEQKEKLRFGYYGRLIKEKGIDVLCKLSQDKDLEQIEIHIWGEGDGYPPSFFDKFPHLHFHGPFSGEKQLTEVINSLDAYLLLSTHPEGLPIALLEVMSAGLPWIATDKGGISDIVCDEISTRVIPSEAEYDAMKAEVLSLSIDILNGKLDKSAQKKMYETKYSSDVLIKRWLNEFEIER